MRRFQRCGRQLEFDWRATAVESLPEPSEPSQQPCASACVSSVKSNGYEPGHPWHYHANGDAAAPLPVADIPPCKISPEFFQPELPKSLAKRKARLRALIEEESLLLEQTVVRYQQVIERGAEALSRYDREIAYGGDDDMARAGTLALLYNQISWHRGRLEWLKGYR